ncbi:MAG: glycoside hydrolase family 36 protein [Patescibacteria group bacterium]
MQKPSLGWQSWSPPFPTWHGFPRLDYSPFAKSASIKSSPCPKSSPLNIRYWCSWYAYGWNINDQKIKATLARIKKFRLPFTHILIDDGWAVWGDWHTPNLHRFPNLAATINKIKSNRLQVGLWLTPFMASKKSQLFQTHPEWFISHRGRPVQGLKTLPLLEFFLPQQYLLNFELPEVKKYLAGFIDLAVKKWGVTLLKLDYLFAPYFNPNHLSDRLPHQHITWLLTYIKTRYPHVHTLASGAPFTSSMGVADIIRISKDPALPPLVPNWLNRFIYRQRLKILQQKLKILGLLSNLNIDPDVRLFSLDTLATQSIWTTIPANILGVGDNLTSLSVLKLKSIKLWLTQPAPAAISLKLSSSK